MVKYYSFTFSIFLLLIAITFNACVEKKAVEDWRHVEISPIDNSQVITVITKGNKRYFMNGSHKDIPKDSFLLLDLSKVDRLGDGFSICWDEPDGYRWKIASTYASLIENKLDTTKYLYYQPIGENSQSISALYKKDNCGSILIREYRQPYGSFKIKYIK